MILFFIGEIVLIRTALNASNEYSAIVSLSTKDDISTLPYATYEGFLSKEFNRFFFGATSDCSSTFLSINLFSSFTFPSKLLAAVHVETLYLWFFSWINDHCPATMDQMNCQGCFDYSLTFCEANQNLCYKNPEEGNIYCPYTICRYGILSYFHSRIKYVLKYILLFLFTSSSFSFLRILGIGNLQ